MKEFKNQESPSSLSAVGLQMSGLQVGMECSSRDLPAYDGHAMREK